MNLLSKTNIVNGNVIQATDVSQIVDAFTYQVAYDLLISGSIAIGSGSTLAGTKLYLTGGNVKIDASVSASSFTGSFQGNGASLTGIVSSSYAVTASYANFAQTAGTASFASNISGASGYIPVFNTPLSLGTSIMFQSGSSIILNNGSGPTLFNFDVGGSGRFTGNLNITGSTTVRSLIISSSLFDSTNSSGSYGQIAQSIGSNGFIWVTSVSSSVSSSFATTASYALSANISNSISGTFGFIPLFSGSNSLSNSLIFQTGSGVWINKPASSTTTGTNHQISGSVSITFGSGSDNLLVMSPGTASGGGGLTIRADGNLSFGANSGIFFIGSTEYMRLPAIGGSTPGLFTPLSSTTGWNFLNSIGTPFMTIQDDTLSFRSVISSGTSQFARLKYSGSNIAGQINLNLTLIPDAAVSNHKGINVTIKAGDSDTGASAQNFGTAGNLYLGAGNTQSGSQIFNAPGGNIFISGGLGTGTGSIGSINFYTALPLTASSSTPQNLSLLLTLSGSTTYIYGNLSLSSSYYDSNNSSGSYGQVLQALNGKTLWVSSVSSSVSSSFTVTASYVNGLLNGTNNFIPVFTGSGLGNSKIYQNLSTIGINTTASSVFSLDVNGYTRLNSLKLVGQLTSSDGSFACISNYSAPASVKSANYAEGFQEYSFVVADPGFYGYIGVQSWAYVIGGLGNQPLAGKFNNYINAFSAGQVWDGSGNSGSNNQLGNSISYFSGMNSQTGSILNAYDFYASELNSVGSTTLPPVVTNHYVLYSEPLSKATNNYGVYMSGSAVNYMGGKLFIGIAGTSVSASAAANLYSFIVQGNSSFTGSLTVTGSATISGSLILQGGEVISVSVITGSVSLGGNYVQYVYSGTGSSTWTLPLVSNSTGSYFMIKSRGTGSLTVQASGSDQLFSTVPTGSVILTTGNALILVNDGTYWLVQ